MKRLVYIITILISIMAVNTYALRSTRFYPTFEMDTQINDSRIALYFGFQGEEAYKFTQKITLDTSKVTIREVVGINGFKVSYREESKKGKEVTYSFDVEGDTIYSDILGFAILLKIEDSFKVKHQYEFKVFDIYAYSDDGSKYRFEGYHVNLRKERSDEMLAMREDINSSTKRTRLIYKLLPYIIVTLISVFIIVFAIIIIPPKRIEDRHGKIKAQLDKKNYPIPGVGAFPRVRKKEKRDIIEPEEKQIVPLGKFLSKSTESNEALKNKELEVDEDMFDNNPTRNKDIGLVNINPLAFDDGEEHVVDDGKDDDLEEL